VLFGHGLRDGSRTSPTNARVSLLTGHEHYQAALIAVCQSLSEPVWLGPYRWGSLVLFQYIDLP